MRASVVTARGIAAGPLADVLGEVGVTEVWVVGNAIGDRYIFDPAPDFVVGMLNTQPQEVGASRPEGLSNLDVMFRIGRSVGQGIPALLIIPPPLTVPSWAQGVVLVQCPTDNRGALRLHLWAFTAAMPSRGGVPSPASEARPRRIDAPKVLKELRRLSETRPPGANFEMIVSNLLQQAGAELVENERRRDPDDRVDLAFVSSDEPANVFIAEVKAGRLTEQSIVQAEAYLMHQVIQRRASLGVVIYYDIDGQKFPPSHNTPMTIRLSLEELVEQLDSRTLIEVISDAVADAAGQK